jgi:flagellar biosynthesis regulator FlaF
MTDRDRKIFELAIAQAHAKAKGLTDKKAFDALFFAMRQEEITLDDLRGTINYLVGYLSAFIQSFESGLKVKAQC